MENRELNKTLNMEGIRPDFGKNVQETFLKNTEVMSKNLDLAKEIPDIYTGIINS